MWNYDGDEWVLSETPDPRWEGDPEDKDLTLEEYLWKRVNRLEEEKAEMVNKIYSLEKKLRNTTVAPSPFLPPPIGGA